MNFKKRISIEQVEEGVELAPKFDSKGVIPCITVHAQTKEVLMFAYMNEEAMQLTGMTNLEKIADQFLAYGPKMVIIKKGGSGSLLAFEKKKVNISIVPNTPVLDPTGAGDSFAGGFLGYISKFGLDNPINAVVHGTVTASYTVSGFGLEKLCTIEDDDFNNKIKEIKIS